MLTLQQSSRKRFRGKSTEKEKPTRFPEIVTFCGETLKGNSALTFAII